MTFEGKRGSKNNLKNTDIFRTEIEKIYQYDNLIYSFCLSQIHSGYDYSKGKLIKSIVFLNSKMVNYL